MALKFQILEKNKSELRPLTSQLFNSAESVSIVSYQSRSEVKKTTECDLHFFFWYGYFSFCNNNTWNFLLLE